MIETYEVINLTREELATVTAALKTAVEGLGYIMYDFGGENYLAPLPGRSSPQNEITTAMFGIWKVKSVIIDGKEVLVK